MRSHATPAAAIGMRAMAGWGSLSLRATCISLRGPNRSRGDFSFGKKTDTLAGRWAARVPRRPSHAEVRREQSLWVGRGSDPGCPELGTCVV